MVFFFFLIGSLSLLWFITGLKMNKTDPNNENRKDLSQLLAFNYSYHSDWLCYIPTLYGIWRLIGSV